MTVLYSYPGTSIHLLNEFGRLSDCVCCCENLPATLWFHIEPDYNSPDCIGIDTGFSDTRNPPSVVYQGDTFIIPSCDGWSEQSPFNETILQCKSGSVEEPPVTFGLISHMYCLAVNRFFVDICWASPAAPGDFDSCVRLITYEPIFSRTCEAGPGEFLVDLGSIIPLEGHPTLACDCTFHVWIDENPGIVSAEMNPIYFYPAEASRGVPGVENRLWFWELLPDVGSPLNLDRRPTMRSNIQIPNEIKNILDKL